VPVHAGRPGAEATGLPGHHLSHGAGGILEHDHVPGPRLAGLDTGSQAETQGADAEQDREEHCGEGSA
jgi:hypothetical protein